MVNWSKSELEDFEKRYANDLKARKDEDKGAPVETGVPLYKVLAQDRPDTMNKLEKAWYDHLIRTTDYLIFSQALKLRMADKTWYTPDFFCLCPDGIVRIFETKGFFRDDAAVKLKTTAEMYSCFRFYLVKKAKGGAWDIKPIPPHKDPL